MVIRRLKNIHKIASFSNSASSSRFGYVGRFCKKGNKSSLEEEFQKSLLVCSRCKCAYYCSKECQKADWKEHKKGCEPLDKKMEKVAGGMQQTIMGFINRNYYNILKEVIAVIDREKVDKKELVLELNFHAEDGSAPALKDPPEFKVGLTRRYLDGSRPDEPDWFYKGDCVYEKNVAGWRAGLEDHYKRMTSNHLLTTARYPSADSGVYRVQLTSEATGKHLFSDEALNAFRRCVFENDDDGLGNVYRGEQLSYIKERRNRERAIRLGRATSQSAGGGDSFPADMADLQRNIQNFMQTDEWRRMQEEFGDPDPHEESD